MTSHSDSVSGPGLERIALGDAELADVVEQAPDDELLVGRDVGVDRRGQGDREPRDVAQVGACDGVLGLDRRGQALHDRAVAGALAATERLVLVEQGGDRLDADHAAAVERGLDRVAGLTDVGAQDQEGPRARLERLGDEGRVRLGSGGDDLGARGRRAQRGHGRVEADLGQQFDVDDHDVDVVGQGDGVVEVVGRVDRDHLAAPGQRGAHGGVGGHPSPRHERSAGPSCSGPRHRSGTWHGREVTASRGDGRCAGAVGRGDERRPRATSGARARRGAGRAPAAPRAAVRRDGRGR